MSKEILYVVDAVSNERGIDKDIIVSAIEAALAAATKKRHDGEVDIRVSIDRNSGDYKTFRRWLVVDAEAFDEAEDPSFADAHIVVDDAQAQQPGIAVGEYIEEPIESMAFGRIAPQTAK